MMLPFRWTVINSLSERERFLFYGKEIIEQGTFMIITLKIISYNSIM